jgi:hypothetical protein
MQEREDLNIFDMDRFATLLNTSGHCAEMSVADPSSLSYGSSNVAVELYMDSILIQNP